MPNKTIYVSDEDGPLFRRAQELVGGNLSAAIAKAVRGFVEAEEGRMAGFEEITVRVGDTRGRRMKRFRGRPVAHWVHRDSSERSETFTVYRTEQGRYAVHTEKGRSWDPRSEPWKWMEQLAGMWPSGTDNPFRHSHGHKHGWHGHQHWAGGFHHLVEPGESSLDVFDTFEEFKAVVPRPVSEQVEENEANPPVDDLDI